MNKWIIIGFLWMGSLANHAQAQQKPLERLTDKFEEAWKARLREKLYVHTDRNTFVAGEVLWFKMYVTKGSDGHLLGLSKVAYVELLDADNKPIMQTMIPLDGGLGDGSLLLSSSLPTGRYRLRAYTRWMRNKSPERYFSTTISVINTHQTLDSSFIQKQKDYRADFYPEGGNLVNGLTSVVGVRAGDAYGGIDFKGVLVDDQQDTLLHFSSLVFGLGKFSFTPQNGTRYKAILRFPNGDSLIRELPSALSSGYVMELNNASPSELRLLVSVSPQQPAHSGDKIFVIIHHQEKVVYAGEIKIQQGKASAIIKKSHLPQGVSVITVFNDNQQPVCERLYFKKPESRMDIVLESVPGETGVRSKVDIPIETLSESKPVSGHLSAAVYLLDSLNGIDPENIFNYWWLSSNLKGHVKHPDFYLDQNNPLADEALENLMLVDGWRKFKQEGIQESKTPLIRFVPEVRGHIITARITDAQTRNPVAGVDVYLSVPGKRVQLHVNKSDSLGMVHFDMPDFYDDKSVVLQTHEAHPERYVLDLFSPFSDKFESEKLPALFVNDDWNASLTKENKQLVIASSYKQDTGRIFYLPKIDSEAVFGKSEVTYMLDDYVRFTTMDEVLREYVKEVNVINRKNNFSLRTFNAESYRLRMVQGNGDFMFQNNPLVLLDGVPVFDINKIIAYDPLKVKRLDVVPAGFHFGPVFYEGVLSFTTYTGQSEGYSFDPNDMILDYKGLQRRRIFKAPEYETEMSKRSPMPDFRTLLFWKPRMETGSDGRTHLTFYTGDVQGKFLIVVQGVSADGKMGYSSKTFEVGE